MLPSTLEGQGQLVPKPVPIRAKVSLEKSQDRPASRAFSVHHGLLCPPNPRPSLTVKTSFGRQLQAKTLLTPTLEPF